MTDMAIVEAIRAAGTGLRPEAPEAINQTIDVQAVQRFESVMNVQGPAEVPFASQVSGVWQAAQDNHQGILHRIKALTELSAMRGPSAAELSELQYEVANLSFQMEVVTNVAKKASDAVSTLVKNG